MKMSYTSDVTDNTILLEVIQSVIQSLSVRPARCADRRSLDKDLEAALVNSAYCVLQTTQQCTGERLQRDLDPIIHMYICVQRHTYGRQQDIHRVAPAS